MIVCTTLILMTRNDAKPTNLIANIKKLMPGLNVGRKCAVVFDIDGTLVDVSSIQHLVEGQNRDFDRFHRESVDCPPYDQVLAIAQRLLRESLMVIAFSGRQEKYRSLTNYWCAIHSLPFNDLILRPNESQLKRIDFKHEAIINLSDQYKIIAIFDNDPELLSLWRSMGIPLVIQCPDLTILKRD